MSTVGTVTREQEMLPPLPSGLSSATGRNEKLSRCFMCLRSRARACGVLNCCPSGLPRTSSGSGSRASWRVQSTLQKKF